MSFLEDLKKSIGGAADYTVKKTGEVTGAAKIRMDIRARNTRLEKCFETIGRAYYKQEKGIGEGHGETIDTAIAEADEIKAEIAQLRTQLAKIQGCVICSACGAQISDQSIFCPMCGVKLPEPEEPVTSEEPAEETESAPAEDTVSEPEAETDTETETESSDEE